MSKDGEKNLNGWGDAHSELAPEQCELLVEELKRFEPHLAPNLVDPETREAFYDAGEDRVCVTKQNGFDDLEIIWGVMLLRTVMSAPEASGALPVVTEYRHHISVINGQTCDPRYERLDWSVDIENGGHPRRILSPAAQQAMEAYGREENNEAAVRIIVENEAAEREQIREMEELTGVDDSNFTPERFDKIMSLLGQITDPASEKLE